MHFTKLVLFALFLNGLFHSTVEAETYTADVVIYGGTSAGVVAAVQTVRMGKSVIIVGPDTHLGGLTAGGLGFTDSGNVETIGGVAREFYHRIWRAYLPDSAWKWQARNSFTARGQGTKAIIPEDKTMWIFEPHVAEGVYDAWVKELDISVHRDEWLNRKSGLVKENNHIKSITMLSGKVYNASMFIDATYEGDLLAAAGVSYHVGREGRNVYGEKWNGIQVGVLHHGHHFKTDVSPYVIPGDPSSGVLPRISTEAPGTKHDGDRRLQAYCYRMCLTNHPDNRVLNTKPIGYDPTQYELLVRVYDAGWRETFNKFDNIPNKKTDTNNHGPFSMDNIGMNYDYPEGSYERRAEILKEHRLYQQGLMYFIANDPRIPKDVQKEFRKWGLSKDEFIDNDHWPHQIYVREARRMIGEYVMTEHDTLSTREVPKPVGTGSYVLDSHNVQRYIKPDGFVQNEGDIGVKPKKSYPISYGSITPKKNECGNLLVPVCVSSSHIAFGSIRMEPVFMLLGQSAATAAVHAIDESKNVQDIDYERLRERLIKDGQRF